MRIRPMLLTLALVLLIPGTAFADGGDIVGTVYLDNQPGSGLCVDVLDNGGNAIASQLTNGGGDYNIYVAQPGSYMVRFADCGAGYTTTQWYPNAPTQADGQAVEVVADGITPNVNGYLYSAGRVTGKLKDNLNAVLTGACVKAEDQNGSPIAETTTDGNGDYVLGGLLPGAVNIHFEGCSAGNYVREYYDDAATELTATPVMVEAGDTKSGIDAVLQAAGRISGHVRNADGEPLPGMCVTGWADGAEVAGAVSDSNGAYEIREVPPTGTYELSAYDCFGSTYMADQGTGPLAGTGTVTLDFTLPLPGHITGHVRDEGGTGLASICVTGQQEGSDNAVAAETDTNGYYELNQVAPGTYDLTFSDCHSTGDWVTAGKAGVVLADGATVMDVDQALKHPDPKPAPAPDPVSSGGGDPAPSPASGDPVASGSSGGDVPRPVVAPASCKVPKLAGLTLAKAKKRLRAAHCKLGKVTRKHSRRRAKKRTVLAQRMKAGTVALTVAK